MSVGAGSIGGVTNEIRAVEEALERLISGLGTLNHLAEQLSTLRSGELHAGVQISRLERVLDFERVAAHVRGAVARAELVDQPIPHLLASTLLPPDVFAVVVDAIPSRVFFEGRAVEGQELRVPPRLAPTHAIVTWMFLNDIVLRTLSNIVLARFAEPLAAYTRERFPELPPFGDWNVEITLSQARIVRRAAGSAGRKSTERPWDFLNGIVSLARDRESEEYGGTLHGMACPLRANTALIYLGPVEAYTCASIPSDAPAKVEQYTYEFGIGPAAAARHRLTGLMGSVGRRG